MWALLFLLGLAFRHGLSDHGHGWWVWTAAAGTVLGLFGYWFMARRQRHLQAANGRAQPSAG